MLSLIEVKCPHCGAQGQIMLPPLGAIIVGPCPECDGMVAVFCGRVLPLDTEIMRQGAVEEKKGHLLEVIGVFLQDRIERLFGDGAESKKVLSDEMELEGTSGSHAEKVDLFGNAPTGPITSEEVASFLNVDLRLIDNEEYFRAVFE